MTFSKSNFVFLVLTYFIVSSCFAKNKPQSDVSNSPTYTSDKPRQPMDQTFNINNWGFRSADRKILLEMKSKIDSLQEKSTPTGNSFTFIVFENYRLDIERVADITRLNVIILSKRNYMFQSQFVLKMVGSATETSATSSSTFEP